MRRVLPIPLLLLFLIAALLLLLDRTGPDSAPSRPADSSDEAGGTPPPVVPDEEAEVAPEATGGAFAPRRAARYVPGRAGSVPEELRGKGDCTLILRLLDRRNPETPEIRAFLWRLSLPEAGDWPAGDQIEREIHVPPEGLLIEKLAAGRYRVEVPDRARGAEDPPAFDVFGPRTDVELWIDRPEEFRVGLHLFDGTGAPIRRAPFEFGPLVRTEAHLFQPPGWATARRKAGHRNLIPGGPPPKRTLGRSVNRELTCGPEGFDLGRLAPANEERDVNVLFDDRCEVWCKLTGALAANPILVGVAATDARLVEDVRNPDGTRAAAAELSVRAITWAVAAGNRRPDRFWIEVPIAVSVAAEGYEPLRFRWRGAQVGRDDLVLVPRGR